MFHFVISQNNKGCPVDVSIWKSNLSHLLLGHLGSVVVYQVFSSVFKLFCLHPRYAVSVQSICLIHQMFHLRFISSL